ncbi:aminotransferase class IV [Streptomyces sp. NPDC002530]
MTTPSAPLPYAEFDGRPATEDDLRAMAFAGFGHFTAMQVRGGRVRGLALHLERLDSAHRELFGLPLEGDRVRELVRRAMKGAGAVDASVRVYGLRAPDGAGALPVVTVRGPARMAPEPTSLLPVPYARTAPHLKRAGDFGQVHSGLLARRAGFDDALLTLPDGEVTEGAITNIGFWDGTSVVWPQAPALLGITMALLERGLPGAGVPSVRRSVTVEGLGGCRAAFVTNSQGMAPVARIGTARFTVDEELMGRLAAVYEAVPADEI